MRRWMGVLNSNSAQVKKDLGRKTFDDTYWQSPKFYCPYTTKPIKTLFLLSIDNKSQKNDANYFKISRYKTLTLHLLRCTSHQ